MEEQTVSVAWAWGCRLTEEERLPASALAIAHGWTLLTHLRVDAGHAPVSRAPLGGNDTIRPDVVTAVLMLALAIEFRIGQHQSARCARRQKMSPEPNEF